MHEFMNQELSHHSVSRVEIRTLQGFYPRYHGKNAVKGNHGYGRKIVAALITTDSGIQGWGELCRPAGSEDETVPNIVGQRVGNLIKTDVGILDDTLFALDIALHDLAGRILGLPVSRMICAQASKAVAIYDGAIYMNDLIDHNAPDIPDVVVRDCISDYEAGYQAFKVKIGRGHLWMNRKDGLARDIWIVQEIHRRLPDALIMVDANDGYSLQETIEFLEGVKGCPLYWIEEPFRENVYELKQLKAYLTKNFPGVRIADGESFLDEPLLDSLLGCSLVDVALPDICSYGFTPWRRRLERMPAEGWKAGPHAWGNKIKTHYCAHLAAAYPGKIPYVEGVLGTTDHVEYSGYQVERGMLSIPQKPGFGMELI